MGHDLPRDRHQLPRVSPLLTPAPSLTAKKKNLTRGSLFPHRHPRSVNAFPLPQGCGRCIAGGASCQVALFFVSHFCRAKGVHCKIESPISLVGEIKLFYLRREHRWGGRVNSRRGKSGNGQEFPTMSRRQSQHIGMRMRTTRGSRRKATKKRRATPPKVKQKDAFKRELFQLDQGHWSGKKKPMAQIRV
ncbi:hypothetical protein BC940DRAFT_1125 [Gongronella butleri]|nr:hypothetical protein BC940DRAFT_1125 [Gongronella butleri]